MSIVHFIDFSFSYKKKYKTTLQRQVQLEIVLFLQYSQYTRYWVALWGSSVIYFGAKLLSGPEDRHREAYRLDPCKMHSIQGWMVVLGDNPQQPGVFILSDPIKGL